MLLQCQLLEALPERAIRARSPPLPGPGGQLQLARAGPANWDARAQDVALGAVLGSGVTLRKGPWGRREARNPSLQTSTRPHVSPDGGLTCWRGTGSCPWTFGGPGGGPGLCLFLCPLPPGEALAAAVPGPSVLRPPQPAIHCASSVHSLGRVPDAALALGGRPRRAGRAALPPLCPPSVSCPRGRLPGRCEGRARLRVTSGASEGAAAAAMPGPRSWRRTEGACPPGTLGNL